MTDKQYIRISPDLNILYDLSNGISCPPYGDEVSNDDSKLGPLFRIIVPGLDEWVRRYEDATDFADTVTDPSFDWKSWHFEGLQFAKAIWQQLPRCFSLFYQPPFEDTSGIIKEFEVDEKIDNLIELLGPESSFERTKPALRYDIDFSATKGENSVTVYFKVGASKYDMTIPFSQLDSLTEWLEDLTICTWSTGKPIHQVYLRDCTLMFFQQTIGVHKGMGQFWICEKYRESPEFSAYVNTKAFIKGFYLAVMNALGFGIYKGGRDVDNPTGEELKRAWEPYNRFKSTEVESVIFGCEYLLKNTGPINETFVMFPEYGGCIFWDTMGVGSGEYYELWADCGDIKLNVPGLKEWSEYYDRPEDHPSFEVHWKQGWELALEVRKQLPDNIDLYYMCYDPRHPHRLINYNCGLLKIIVPRTSLTLFDISFEEYT